MKAKTLGEIEIEFDNIVKDYEKVGLVNPLVKRLCKDLLLVGYKRGFVNGLLAGVQALEQEHFKFVVEAEKVKK